MTTTTDNKGILPDVNNLIATAASLTDLASHLGSQASNSIGLIDEQLGKIETLIAAKVEATNEATARILADSDTEIEVLRQLASSLINIREAFAEPQVRG